MTAVWPSLSVPHKEQALKPFAFDAGKANALAILHLAACDGVLSVQGRAFSHPIGYAFQDFGADHGAYQRWHETYKDSPPGVVLSANAERYVSDLLALSPSDLGRRLADMDRLDLRAGKRHGVDLASVMRAAGGTKVLETGLQSSDVAVRRKALELAHVLEPDEAWLRTWILPGIVQSVDADAGMLPGSFQALGRAQCGWAKEPILEYLRQQTSAATQFSSANVAAQALLQIGDPTSIPALIELLQQDQSGRLRHDIGPVLAHFAGVRWSKEYDAAWWLDWWEKNKERLPPEVRGAVIQR